MYTTGVRVGRIVDHVVPTQCVDHGRNFGDTGLTSSQKDGAVLNTLRGPQGRRGTSRLCLDPSLSTPKSKVVPVSPFEGSERGRTTLPVASGNLH